MRSGLASRVVSLFAVFAIIALASAPAVAAGDNGALVVTAVDGPPVIEGIAGTFYWGIADPAPDYPYSAHVDWGDGSVSDLSVQSVPSGSLAVTHTYRASDPIPGAGGTVYTATMTVTDATGASGSASQHVPVQNIAPVITAPAAISVPEGPITNLTLATFDDASVGPWHVRVVNSLGGYLDFTPQAPSAIVVPWDPSWGNATLYVYVQDRGGLISMATIHVSTANTPPTVGTVKTLPDQPVVGQAVLASATFTDPGMTDFPNPETYTCTVDYGDGSGPQTGAAAQGTCTGPGHTYTGAGTFTVSVRVSDSNGGSGTNSRTVTVGAGAPQVGPVVVPGPLVEGQAFVASTSFNATSPQLCTVDFGDGTGTSYGTISGSTCSAPNFAYPDAGTYTLTFTVTDAYGGAGSAHATVVVGNVAPVVENVITWGTPSAGGVVSAHATFHDPALGIATYTCNVDFGDGTGPQPGIVGDADCTADHTYSQGGLYTVTVTVSDGNGGSGSASASVPIANLSPTVGPISFSGDLVEGGNVQASASFTDPWSVANFAYCSIDYGDGGSFSWSTYGQTCLAPEHDYSRPGIYTVSLAVDRGYGASGTSTTTITIANVAPVVTPDHVVTFGPSGVDPGTWVVFTEPGMGFETYTCTIDFGDGGGAQEGTINGNVCIGPAHAYAARGTYTLVASVADSNGGVGTYSVAIVIYNPSPSVGPVSAPASVNVGSAVSASATYVATGLDPADTCMVDYGDGSGPLAGAADGATCKGPLHTYSKTGSFAITVKVSAANGASAASSAAISVLPPALAVGPISVAGSAAEGSAVTASATFKPTGTQTYTCKVDYGDGTGAQTGSISGTTCKGPGHRYGRPGSFTVRVSVTGSKGNAGSSSKTLVVANVAPTFTKVTIPSTVKLGSPASMSATFADPGTAETYVVRWTWGDGTTTTTTLASGVRTLSGTHTYARSGAYQVNLSLTDGTLDDASTVNYNSGIAVYDPARAITGSGTFPSPAGSCTLTRQCGAASTGTFSLSASYAKGAVKPTVCFKFSAAGVTFTATSADWFVAADGKAAILGTGTLNGVGGYRFGLDLIDGKADVIAITILDSKGNTVYFNNGAPPLKTGSITIS